MNKLNTLKIFKLQYKIKLASVLFVLSSFSTGCLAVSATLTEVVVSPSDTPKSGVSGSSHSPSPIASSSPVASLVVSSDDLLSSFVLSGGTLSPAFSPSTKNYTLSISNGVTSITVTPTVHQANATIRVNGVTQSSGLPSGALSMSVGSNSVAVVVTAQDRLNSNTYTFDITRSPGPATQFSLSLIDSPQVSGGTPVSLTVTAKDAQGYTATGYSGTVTINSSDGAATLPAAHALSNGAYLFSNSIVFNTAGSQTITVTDGSISKTSNTVTVNGVGGYRVFHYTGSDQSFTSSTRLNVAARMWGAGGGASLGGGGGYTAANLGLIYNNSYTVIVGESGNDNLVNANTKTYGGGGAIDQSYAYTSASYGMYGGGRTAIQVAANDILTAGGGGAGDVTGYRTSPGGAGGGLNGIGGGASDSGRGGTQTAGGANGYGGGTSGAKYIGGTGNYGGGGYGVGGGGGYYGGGGGGPYSRAGGGGSSYLGTYSGTGSTTAGSGSAPGNSTDPHLLNDCASTERANGSNIGSSITAGHGCAVFYWGASVSSVTITGATNLKVIGFNLTSDTTMKVDGTSCDSMSFVSSDEMACTISLTPGSHTAVVSVPGYSDSTVPVTIGAVTQFTFSSLSGLSAKVPFSLTVSAKDPMGNLVPSYASTVTLTSSDGIAILPAPHALSGGVYTFSGLQINTISSPTFTATAGSISSTATAAVNANPCATGGSQVFHYTGANQSFSPPSAACSVVSARLWGAGGGGSVGGGGGYAFAAMNLTYGSSYNVIVGQNGNANMVNANVNTFGGGGAIDRTYAYTGLSYGVYGGGRTAVQLTSADILTAGGGGAGDASSGRASPGGAGGGLIGIGGGASDSGRGGTQSAGGAAGSGGSYTGAQYLGGTGTYGGGNYGVGAGGGYYGGGGGGGYSRAGGGGSSYLGAYTAFGSTTAGSGSTVGNSSDLHLSDCVAVDRGAGAVIGSSINAGNGCAIVYWGASVTGITTSGTTATITGFNLTSDTTVTINGASCTGVNFVSSDQITCTFSLSPGTYGAVVSVPLYGATISSSVIVN